MVFLFLAICLCACLFFGVVLFHWVRDGQPKRETRIGIRMGIEEQVAETLDENSREVIDLPV
jgi:hypothetical protein